MGEGERFEVLQRGVVLGWDREDEEFEDEGDGVVWEAKGCGDGTRVVEPRGLRWGWSRGARGRLFRCGFDCWGSFFLDRIQSSRVHAWVRDGCAWESVWVERVERAMNCPVSTADEGQTRSWRVGVKALLVLRRALVLVQEGKR